MQFQDNNMIEIDGRWVDKSKIPKAMAKWLEVDQDKKVERVVYNGVEVNLLGGQHIVDEAHRSMIKPDRTIRCIEWPGKGSPDEELGKAVEPNTGLEVPRECEVDGTKYLLMGVG